MKKDCELTSLQENKEEGLFERVRLPSSLPVSIISGTGLEERS